MLAPIASAIAALAGPGAEVLFELQAAAGVPDVVAVVLDPLVVAARAASGFVTDLVSVATLLALSDALVGGRALTSREAALAAGVTTRYALSTILPGLMDRGLVDRVEGGSWVATARYKSPVRHLVTIEAKLRDWRRGLGQASRHAAGADAAWLVLDSRFTRPATAAADWFGVTGVGLASLTPDEGIHRLFSPCAAQVLPVRRELLAQRAAALHSSGAASGAIGPVFGRILRPTRGPDPRLVGAVGR